MPLDMTANANSTEVIKSPLSMLYHWEQTSGDDVFLTQPVNGEYQNYTWKQVGNLARRVAKRLEEMALPAGSRIGIFSKKLCRMVHYRFRYYDGRARLRANFLYCWP